MWPGAGGQKPPTTSNIAAWTLQRWPLAALVTSLTMLGAPRPLLLLQPDSCDPPKVVTVTKRIRERERRTWDIWHILTNRIVLKRKWDTPDMARNNWIRSREMSAAHIRFRKEQRHVDMWTHVCAHTGEAPGLSHDRTMILSFFTNTLPVRN